MQRTCAFTGILAFLGDARCGCNECDCDFNNNNAEPAGDGTCRPVSNKFEHENLTNSTMYSIFSVLRVILSLSVN